MENEQKDAKYRCAKCGHLFKSSSSFCPNCGERKALAVKPADNTCENCGAVYSDEQKFCTKCGKPLRTLVFCEHCAKNGLPISLVDGARYCCKCGGAVSQQRVDFRAYQAEVAQRQDMDENTCFMARVIGSYGYGYGSGVYPLLEWNNLLVAINSGTIYVYNMLAAKDGGITLRPFCYNGGDYPKVTCPIGVAREVEGRFPSLYKVVNGMLAVPCVDRIFLWDIAGNVMRREKEERRGGRKGMELELKGRIAADLAGDDQRYLAALVRTSEDLQLYVYEILGDSVSLYYTWSLGGDLNGLFNVYVTSHFAYVLVQKDVDEPGDLLCFSLDTFKTVPLDNWRGRCRPILSFDNTDELIHIERGDGYSDVHHLNGLQAEPVLLLDNVILPQCCGRDGQAFWIVGRSLLFADGQNNFSVINGLDESMMRMSVPPVRSLYGLCFVDDKGGLCAIRQNRIAPWKKKLEVRLNGRELHLNRLSPWFAKGACMYGFSDEGLIAVDMSEAYAIPDDEQTAFA